MISDKSVHLIDGHDPFWPGVDLNRLRERLDLREQPSDTAFEVATRCAVIEAAHEFAQWRAVLRGLGYNRLEQVGGHDHGKALLVCYHRLIEASVKRRLGGQAHV